MGEEKKRKTKCVRIDEDIHKEAKDISNIKGYHFGKYCDNAISEKNKKEKSKIK